MRRLTGLAITLAVILLASGIAWARATTETYNIKHPESFTINNPCQGYEEPILVEGVFHTTSHVTRVDGDVNPRVYHYANKTNATNVTGIGLETGDEYRFINPSTQTGTSSTGPMGMNFTYEVSYIIVSKGASPNFILHEVYRQVIAQDSDPFITIEKRWASCTAGVATASATATATPTSTATATPTATAQPLP